MQAIVSSAVAGTDQVDEFVEAFYLGSDSVDMTEQEDVDFYELYNTGALTHQLSTPGIGHTPRSVATEQLPEDEDLMLLEDLLNEMLSHRKDSSRHNDSTVVDDTRITIAAQEERKGSPIYHNQELSSHAIRVRVQESS